MPDDKGRILLAIARFAIAKTLGQPCEANEDVSWLQDEAACFVTLMQRDNLRGCIGTLNAHRALLDDVKHNAHAAAFQDTRFRPLTSEELDITDIEISLLSPMQSLNFSSEQEALTQLRPGIDGVVFEFNHYRSTFLPQVWEQLPETKDFIAHLKNKAGLATDFWSDEIKLSNYTVEKWKERDFMTSSEEKVI
ncbi:MAG: AmmeMemoRadiSam system protein A [Gammaproteobacteria bacterium]|nr:AmmeMemoRadiSam system protein A [Gammaproteobacteria bacterium]